MINSSFSTLNPSLQLAIDSTSLNAFEKCAQFYNLSIRLGYAPRIESVHLTFGLLLHGAVERYHHLMATPERQKSARSHDWALHRIVKWVMLETWDKERDCPWQSDHPTKNRFTLIRTIIWYLDLYQDDPLRTVILPNNKPAVELSFSFDSGYRTHSTNERVIICGHFDRFTQLHSSHYISDIKSTGSTISASYFDGFTPANQITIYAIGGKTAFHIDAEGVLVDAVQITQTGTGGKSNAPIGPLSLFKRRLIPRSEFQLEEWHTKLGIRLAELEQCATTDIWPMRETSCNLYGGCAFRAVCAQPSKESRQIVLDGLYTRRVWDPLQHRGDI